MAYANTSLAAQMACELARTGNYGDDGYAGKVAHICEHCGAPIYVGDTYYHEYVPICEDCMHNMTALEFAEMNLIQEEIA